MHNVDNIAELLSRVEQSQDSDSRSRILRSVGRQLLFYPPENVEQEAELYRRMAGFVRQEDESLRQEAIDAISDRWKKVGFYRRHEPLNRELASLFNRNKPWYEEINPAESVRLATLELARQIKNVADPSTLPALTRRISLVAGPDIDQKKLREDLKNVFILSVDGEYIPLVEINRTRVAITGEAFYEILPHLPVLESLVDREIVLTKEDIELKDTINKLIRGTYADAVSLWRKNNFDNLTIDERGHDPNFGFSASPSRINEWLEGGLKSRMSGFKYLALNVGHGHLLTATLSTANSVVTPNDNRFFRIDVSKLPFGMRDGLSFWFFNSLIEGSTVAEITLRDEHRPSITVEGSWIPRAPFDLASAGSVSFSENGVEFFWRNISGQVYNIPLSVIYSKEYGVSFYWGRKFAEKIVAPEANNISVRVTSPEADQDSVLGNTELKEIKLDKEGSFVLDYPDGEYVLNCIPKGNYIAIEISGEDWSRTIVIPKTIDPVNLLRESIDQLKLLLSMIVTEKKVIDGQLRTAKTLSWAEDVALRALAGGLEDEGIYQRAYKAMLESDGLAPIRDVDKQLATLEPVARQVVIGYIQSLIVERRGEKYMQEYKSIFSDRMSTQDQIRKTIKEHKLQIPESLLQLVETIILGNNDLPYN